MRLFDEAGTSLQLEHRSRLPPPDISGELLIINYLIVNYSLTKQLIIVKSFGVDYGIELAIIVWYDSDMNSNPLKIKAERLRDQGFSYNMISEELEIAKSTLSNWFSNKPFIPNQTVLKRIQYGPIKSAEKRHNQKVSNIEQLKIMGAKEIGKLSNRDLWLLGLGLYLGEGSKTFDIIRIINSDPNVIKLAIRWFKDICKLENDNITIAIHIYPDNNELECKTFWEKVTNLPDKNFRKTQIDRRQNKSIIKRNKLPYGTAHITIVSNKHPKRGVYLFRKLTGWMSGALAQI